VSTTRRIENTLKNILINIDPFQSGRREFFKKKPTHAEFRSAADYIAASAP
jgi:hypothetical protein